MTSDTPSVLSVFHRYASYFVQPTHEYKVKLRLNSYEIAK